MSEHLPRSALVPYVGAAAASQVAIEPLGEGLINDTYLVRRQGATLPPAADATLAAVDRWVLQRVNPIFAPSVHEDIEAVTRHLLRRGLATPLLYRTLDGALAAQVDGSVWRMMTFVPGESPRVLSPARAFEAGRLVGRFHVALSDLTHTFRFSRPQAHDLRAHLLSLEQALGQAATAPAGFHPLAEEVLEQARALPAQVPGPLRICHGDLKCNNIRFDPGGRALCLLDLDTLGQLPLCIEMGDALRSWCNAADEDHEEALFDLEIFERALAGYADSASGLLLPEEREGLVAGLFRIALELAARFLTDVVQDRYFRYDPQRFPSRAAHNLVRARGQLSLARAVAAHRAEAEAIVARCLR
ncbi:MAG: phosphotransferase [Myxococcales bacterium]|nr:phosphotransferase [Myxococcota bacterium]MDW8281898.1 phosphotransferase [Myxococcales bacterium]